MIIILLLVTQLIYFVCIFNVYNIDINFLDHVICNHSNLPDTSAVHPSMIHSINIPANRLAVVPQVQCT